MFFATVLVSLSLLFLLNTGKAPSLPKNVKNDFKIHPYALYLLSGGEYSLADSRRSIISVDADAVVKSNAICGLQIFEEDGWTGFVRKNDENFLKFKYRVYKKLDNPEYFVIKCTETGGGSGYFGAAMLIRKHKQKKIFYGKIEYVTILSCEGYFNYNIEDDDLKKVLSFFSETSSRNTM